MRVRVAEVSEERRSRIGMLHGEEGETGDNHSGEREVTVGQISGIRKSEICVSAAQGPPHESNRGPPKCVASSGGKQVLQDGRAVNRPVMFSTQTFIQSGSEREKRERTWGLGFTGARGGVREPGDYFLGNLQGKGHAGDGTSSDVGGKIFEKDRIG